MARTQKPKARRSEEAGTPSQRIARRGIRTASDFAELMSALMTDVICEEITPNIANAACNAGGKLLKVVELNHRHGTADERRGGSKNLILAEKSTHARALNGVGA